MPFHPNEDYLMPRWLIDTEADRAPGNGLQTTREEIDTFRLDPSLVNELAEAYARYLDYLGALSPAIDADRRCHDRQDYPGYGYARLAARPVLLSDLAVRFMVDVCGLPGEQATRFDLKVHAAEHRLGIVIATRPIMMN